MAAGTNSVAVFYSDRTYKHVKWSDAHELMNVKGVSMIAIHVYHHQSTDPTRLPNRVQAGGWSVIAIDHVDGPDFLLLRTIDATTPAGEVRSSRFEAVSKLQSISKLVVDLSPQFATGDLIAHQNLAFTDADYDTLNDDSTVQLRAEAVPDITGTEGTY